MHMLAKKMKIGFSKKESASQKKGWFSHWKSVPIIRDSLSPAMPKIEVMAHLFRPCCQWLSTSMYVMKEQAEKTHSRFCLMSIFPLLTESMLILWKQVHVQHDLENSVRCELLPGQPLTFQGAHWAALTNFRISFFLCNFVISNTYYNQVDSLQPDWYLFLRQALCVKPSYPAQAPLMRQVSVGSTPLVGWVSPRHFPALVRGRIFAAPWFFKGSSSSAQN